MAGRGGKHGKEAAAAAAAARDFDDERGFDFEPNKTRQDKFTKNQYKQ
jgi:hypothetical protein